MYLERAKEVDEKMAENWKADADGILIFVRLYFRFPYSTATYRLQAGLFSAAVASLISVSIQDIQQNPQDTSNFYLANIYQATITDPNRPNISTPSSPPSFTPPNYAIWVNGLWFLSLMISITCALLATLLQQWARRYLKVTQPRYSLHKQARIRSFFAEGVEKSFLPLAVEALPTLLHISLFLFFAGLVVFLWHVNLTIYKIAISWVGVCATFYGCITLVPIIRHDSPYYTPLTPFALLIYVVILRVFFLLRTIVFLPWICRYCDSGFFCQAFLYILRGRPDGPDPPRVWPARFLYSTFMTAEEVALKAPPQIDARAFMWTFDSLDEDHELERFFSSLPDFRSSKVVDDPLPSLTQEEKEKISDTLLRFLGHTLSSDLLPEAVKTQRAIVCAKALDLAEFSQYSGSRLHRAVFDALYKEPRITDFGPIADDSRTGQTIFIQAIATTIAARPRQRDDSWFRQVAPNALGIPETVLRDYAANGDSLSLAILIHVTRQQFTHFGRSSWPTSNFQNILEEVSEFNVQDTSPEVQHEFCALWNQIVLKARNDNDRKIALHILSPLRNVYITLHQDTDSAPTRFSADTDNQNVTLEDPFSYPVCTIAGHVHGNPPRTPFVRTAPHNNTVLVPPSLASPDAPSLSISAPLHVLESSTDVPAQTTTEGLRLPTASASVIDTSAITIHHPTPETPKSVPLPSSPVTLPHNTGLLTSSDSSNLPSSDSLNPFLNHMRRTTTTGPSPSSHSLIIRS
jgi:hypothetical protein